MSKRAIGVLAVVVALLAGYIALFERGSATSTELAERGGRVLVGFVRTKVDRLEVQRKGQRVVLERGTGRPTEDAPLGDWRVIEPYRAKADSDAIDPLLGELEWLSARRTLASLSAEDEARFGLAAPRYRVTYTVGGARETLVIGKDDVHGEGVYVRIAGDPRAFVVPKSVLDPLAHDPGHYRDKILLPGVVVAWTKQLTIQHAGRTVSLARDGDHWWLVEEPKVYADAKRVDDMVELVSLLRATRYLEPGQVAAAEAALEAPSLRVELAVIPDEAREDKKSEKFLLEVGGPCSGHEHERVARAAGGPLACLADGDLKTLEASGDELRERRLIVTDASAVEAIEITLGSRKLALTREGDGWKGSPGASIDAEAVKAWITTLSASRATGFAPLGSLRPRGELTLRALGGKRERVVLGELGPNGELLVRRGEEPVTALFPSALSDVLEPIASRFAPLEVWSRYQPSQIARVEARADGHQRTWALEGGNWKLKSGDLGGDVTRLRELVRALIDLRARVYVTDRPRPVHGVSAEKGTLRLDTSEGQTLSLTLGAETPRGAFAQLDQGPVIEIGRDAIGWWKELAGGPRAAVEPEQADEEGEHEDEEDGHDHAH